MNKDSQINKKKFYQLVVLHQHYQQTMMSYLRTPTFLTLSMYDSFLDKLDTKVHNLKKKTKKQEIKKSRLLTKEYHNYSKTFFLTYL